MQRCKHPQSWENREFSSFIKSAKYFADKVQFDDNISRSVEHVDFITYNKDTLLYFVNYANNNGWIVLSGDKRTEAVLASSNTGKIDRNRLGGAVTWFDDMAGKIYGLKQSNNKNTLSEDYAMWCKIDTLALGIHKQVLSKARSAQRHMSPSYESGGGEKYEYILIDTKIEVISNKQVGPLTITRWGQGLPWNECTPFWQDTKQRCLPGCVAVAGAQMLYYFHHLKNKPSVFYSQGQCTGWVFDKKNKSVAFSFSNPTPDVWSNMPLRVPFGGSTTEGTNLVSILMGYVGWRVNMEYGLEVSSAQTKDLIGLYREFGINSEYAKYNPVAVRTSLDKALPVNVRADSERKRRKILFINAGWEYGGGHSWIIDGYTDKETRYTYTYEMVPKLKPYDPNDPIELLSNANTANQPALYARIPVKTYTESRVSRSYYWKMNYGWNGGGDSGDYLTGEGDVWESGSHNFEYRKSIIHNFSF